MREQISIIYLCLGSNLTEMVSRSSSTVKYIYKIFLYILHIVDMASYMTHRLPSEPLMTYLKALKLFPVSLV